MEEATGIASHEASGRPLVDVVPSLAERGLLTRFEQVLQSGEVQVLAPAFHHYLIPCAPKTPSAHFDRMQQRVTLGALREAVRIVGVMVTIEDVTQRLDEERALAADLRSADPIARDSAARRLAQAESLESPQAMTDALRHDDWRVRRVCGSWPHAPRVARHARVAAHGAAARALGFQRPEQRVAVAVGVGRGPDRAARRTAARSGARPARSGCPRARPAASSGGGRRAGGRARAIPTSTFASTPSKRLACCARRRPPTSWLKLRTPETFSCRFRQWTRWRGSAIRVSSRSSCRSSPA